MRIPIFRRISRKDLPKSPDWIDSLLTPINTFFENVRQGLGRQITFEENISCQIKELIFTTSSTYESANDFTFLSFPSTLNKKAIGCFILQIYVVDLTYVPITIGTSVDWLDVGDGNVKINFISGLADETTYFVRFLVI